MKKLLKKILLFLAPYLAYIIIRTLKATMKFTVLNAGNVKNIYDEKKNIIMAFWHGRLLMMPVVYTGGGISILISMHEDGEVIKRTMDFFGFSSIRGSSTRGGTKAMRDMVRTLRSGGDIAITPDGPRGPRHTVHSGVVTLAKMTGAPILPVTFNASKRKQLGSWDGFILPYPFSSGVFIWGDPIYVGSGADNEELDKKRAEVEEAMREITRKADSYF